MADDAMAADLCTKPLEVLQPHLELPSRHRQSDSGHWTMSQTSATCLISDCRTWAGVKQNDPKGPKRGQRPACNGSGESSKLDMQPIPASIELHRLTHTHTFICPYKLHSHLWSSRSALVGLEDCLHLSKDTSLAANTIWQEFHNNNHTITSDSPTHTTLSHIQYTYTAYAEVTVYISFYVIVVFFMLTLANLKRCGCPQVSDF